MPRSRHNTVSLLKIIFVSEFEWNASWIMSRGFILLICSLNWMTSSDTTGQDTELGTGLSLPRGSGDFFFIFLLQLFLFDGMTDFVKC